MLPHKCNSLETKRLLCKSIIILAIYWVVKFSFLFANEFYSSLQITQLRRPGAGSRSCQMVIGKLYTLRIGVFASFLNRWLIKRHIGELPPICVQCPSTNKDILKPLSVKVLVSERHLGLLLISNTRVALWRIPLFWSYYDPRFVAQRSFTGGFLSRSPRRDLWQPLYFYCQNQISCKWWNLDNIELTASVEIQESLLRTALV